jgi:hypothetical protein
MAQSCKHTNTRRGAVFSYIEGKYCPVAIKTQKDAYRVVFSEITRGFRPQQTELDRWFAMLRSE